MNQLGKSPPFPHQSWILTKATCKMGPGSLFTNIFPLVFPSQMSQPSHLDKSERAKKRPEMESFSARLTLDSPRIVGNIGERWNPRVGHPPCNGSSVPEGWSEERGRDVNNVVGSLLFSHFFTSAPKELVNLLHKGRTGLQQKIVLMNILSCVKQATKSMLKELSSGDFVIT